MHRLLITYMHFKSNVHVCDYTQVHDQSLPNALDIFTIDYMNSSSINLIDLEIPVIHKNVDSESLNKIIMSLDMCH